MFSDLNAKNIDMFCMKHYDNPQCVSEDDYHDDMKRFKYIKRLLNQYEQTKNLKIRLLINHIIMIYNIFDNEAATRILFYKIPEKHWPVLKPILMKLGTMPKVIKSINSKNIINSDITLDQETINQLRLI